jgi:glucosylglycerate synthase
MAITGSSSSAVTGKPVDGGPVDRDPVDIVVGLVARPSPRVDSAAFVREVASVMTGAGASVRWLIAVAHTETAAAEVSLLRRVLNEALVDVPYALQPSDALDVPFHGVPGRARALHALLRETHARGARGCILLDPHSAFPERWLDRLAQPLLTDAADYVTPVYARHPFTGALLHGFVYPTFRALYGVALRYPIAADVACSLRLIKDVVTDPVWDTAAGQLGIDLWLTSTAVSNGFRVAQAGAGPRVDEPSGVDASMAVSQVVGALFSDMEARATIWQRIREPRVVPQFGSSPATPQPPDIDVARLAESFRLGARELQDVWAEVLPPLATLQWRRLANAPLEAFRVDDALWARTVYDFAAGYRQRIIARDHLLPAFAPLYLGWLASFALEVRENPMETAEARLDRLCLAFEREKPYLISLWRWPDRFRPIKRRR